MKHTNTINKTVCVCLTVCVCSHSVLSPRRLRGHALSLRHTRLCVSIHPPRRLLAATPGGRRGDSLLRGKHGCQIERNSVSECDHVRDTDQLHGELCDGSVSAPQLLSELLHLLQESLHLNTHRETQLGLWEGILGNVGAEDAHEAG